MARTRRTTTTKAATATVIHHSGSRSQSNLILELPPLLGIAGRTVFVTSSVWHSVLQCSELDSSRRNQPELSARSGAGVLDQGEYRPKRQRRRARMSYHRPTGRSRPQPRNSGALDLASIL